MVSFSAFALLAAPLALAGSSRVARSSMPETFSLYAYGKGIGGSPVFYHDNLAYLGDPRDLNGSMHDIVLFHNDDGTLVANENATASGDAEAWSNLTFYVPGPTSTAHQVGFTNTTGSSDISTTDFTFYGGVILHKQDSKLLTLWYASPTDTDGIYTLNWNDTGDSSTDGNIIVSLKAKAPTRPAIPPRP
ncbi:hypothetical protein SLS62_003701 [Diatrype stigma]|uniref:Uncharacterized protein n=1 Tax=Diatrype stigma TaxID=117547 RepID=A0AAN9UUN3_9PEZI